PGFYGAPIQSLTYGFDAADRITAITDGVDAYLTQQYQYDDLSRLTRAEQPGGNIATYGYDAVSNRTSTGSTSPASTTAYTIAGTSSRYVYAGQNQLLAEYTNGQ